jgi:sulfocyanin SoxE-like protein
MPLWFRMPAAVAVLAAIACAGRTGNDPVREAAAAPAATPAPVAATPGEPSAAPDWLTLDPANKTATLTLEVTSRAGATSALLNGYRNGAARIVVPVGWTTKWNWRNADTTAHSLVVMVQREKLPLEGGRPAFTNAMTRMVTEGLPSGGTDQTTFVAEEAGWYWLMCGVPGHALAGEWLELRVDPEATTASVLLVHAFAQ